jgi:carbamoyltransferase
MSAFLGIHDGHNASAALIRDGCLVLALQEERLTRVRNQGDAPAGAAALAREAAHGDLAGTALNGHYMNYGQWRRESIVADYQASSTFLARGKQPWKNTFVDRAYQRHKASARLRALARSGIGAEGATPVEHHLAHAAAAYYSSPWGAADANARALVFTCDGSGDRLSATVSIGSRGRLDRIASVSEHDSLGRLYALVTRHLAMFPLEHEYKVMGLAPYAARSSSAASLAQSFQDLFEFHAGGLVWKRGSAVPSMYAAFDLVGRMLARERFDTAAAGVQLFLERMLCIWVRHAIRATGIANIACSGGVFMNVKANLAILELPEVERMYVFPSCGDESNSIGAAAYLAAQAGEPIRPLGALYFGEPITDAEAEAALEPAARLKKLRFTLAPDIEQKTAAALAFGRIVARASGPAEFGARALGNRSILARADAPSLVPVLNQAIKGRDFWMPFAPSVLAERATDYYDKPKPVCSPYMMFAFRSQPGRRAAFPAAQHPHDFTTRPHEVFEQHNPAYHRLLQEFEARTGQGIVLNTSFNLHGEPMVYRASDAVDVFLRSGLEHMALANFWVEKTA